MKKVLSLLTILFLSCNLCFAGTSNNYSVKYHKSGGRTVKSGNTTTRYDKNGRVQNKTIKSGNTTTKYDKNNNVKSKSVKSGNKTYIYDGNGNLKETRTKY